MLKRLNLSQNLLIFALMPLGLNAEVVKLDEIVVKAKPNNFNTISRQKIENSPTLNGSMSELLKSNPNVRFSNTSTTSQNLGDINPSDISINGALTYQNNFMINGFNVNNDLNPGGKRFGTGQNTTHVKEPDIGSISQGIMIDSDLIGSIEVLDSDVSARYGNFMGGVVNAKTRDPKREFSGKFSLTHSSNNWVSYHVEDEEKFKNSTSPNAQPKFKKSIARASLEGFVTENFGIIGSYTQAYSTIPIKYDPKYFSDAHANQTRKMHRKNENFFLAGVWYVGQHVIRPTLIYTPSSATYHTEFMKDSIYDYKNDGLIGSVKVESALNSVLLEQNFGYSKMQSSRIGSKNYQAAWHPSAVKNWASDGVAQEGTFASVEQTQENYEYSFDTTFDEILALNLSHTFSFGGDISQKSGTLIYKDSIIGDGSASELHGACQNGDPLCINDGWEHPYDDDTIGNGQYFDQATRYKGKTKKNITSYGIYAQDKVKFKNLTARFGLRMDKDTFFNNTNIAPRLSLTYDIFDDETSLLGFGANRYYGRNSFSYALDEGKEWLKTELVRKDQLSPWEIKKDDYKANYRFSNLKTPYTDELSFRYFQELDFLSFELKYIMRKDKDGIMTTWRSVENLDPSTDPKYTANHRILTNNGRGEADVVSFALRNNEPFYFIGVNHNFELIFDYTKIKRNYNSYKDTTQDKKRGDKVVLDGKLTHKNDIAREDFNVPYSLRFNTYSSLKTKLGLVRINNFFKFNAGYNGIRYAGLDKTYWIDRYETKHFGSNFIWDMRLGLDILGRKTDAYFINLDILNVLNRKVNVGSNFDYDTENSSSIYAPGRQLWVEIGARF
ncbi:TonB-dependent receptor plug domain-containing protein [Campylobacter geochelonis]|uniref:TonB-dependent receptor plug domain-containing protein n=1 Tax=Campylobacter geochelonis TaxID=1780362 RepID=UPI0007708C89|nr:TonB-dependent receptor plug domain-containing protein [Campylobacter geochelonis]CZE49885.1 putative TonB dependent receptor [Campylobacter geochelonis]